MINFIKITKAVWNKKKRKYILWNLFFIVVFISVLWGAILFYNNISFSSHRSFTDKLDTSILQGCLWVEENEKVISAQKNVALIKMLQECDELSTNPSFFRIVTTLKDTPCRPLCWKRLIDPACVVDGNELNNAIDKEEIDNKWTLYALAPEKAKVTPEELDLWNQSRWQRRQLTHQLWALIHLREINKQYPKNLDQIVEFLSNRLSRELFFDVAVVDIYIQKAAFVVRAGHPEKIRRRWIERIIENQNKDGGWDDRWYCFRSGRRPILKYKSDPSNQHATVQALWLLYQIKYRYPEQFGVQRDLSK